MCACAMPDAWLYGAAMLANRGSASGRTYPSAASVLGPTVASTTRTPAARSSGTSVATTVSIPPYPFGGTGSHGPALTSTVSDALTPGLGPGGVADRPRRRTRRRTDRVSGATVYAHRQASAPPRGIGEAPCFRRTRISVTRQLLRKNA